MSRTMKTPSCPVCRIMLDHVFSSPRMWYGPPLGDISMEIARELRSRGIDHDNDDHTYCMVLSSMSRTPPGMTRAQLRKERLPGSLNAIQPLLKAGKIVKAPSGKYVAT